MSEQILWFASRGSGIVSHVLSSGVVCLGRLTVVRWQRPGWPRFGYGVCAELLPELIELDDSGYPIVRPGAVPDDLLEHARRAVVACPVLALRLRPALRATMPPPAAARVPAPISGG